MKSNFSRQILLLFVFLHITHVTWSQSENINSIDSEKQPEKKVKNSKKLTEVRKKPLIKTEIKSSIKIKEGEEGAQKLEKYKKLDKVKPLQNVSKPVPPSKSKQLVTTLKPPISQDSPVPSAPLNWRHKLRTDLMSRYTKDVHPVKDHRQAVRVDLGMALIHLDLDERKSVLEVDGWMRLNWTDEYLKWDPVQYDNLTQIHFGSEEIWRPDIQLYNNAEGSNLNHYGTTHFLVFPTGVVLWVPPAKFRSFCKVDLRAWPQDTQSCKLKFGSWTSHGNQIDLGLFHNMSSVELLNFYTSNKEWAVLEAVASRSTNTYESVPETYPDVTFTFLLQRESPAYRAAVILPCLVTMLLVVSSFLLPPAAGEKITINAVSFVVCIMYLIYFQVTLPNMKDHIPLIVLFYSNTGALVGIAMVLNVSCISLARERRFSGPPKWMKNIFSGFLGRILCLSNYYNQVSETHQRLVVEMDDISESPESEQIGTDLSQHHGSGGSMVMRDWLLVAAGVERFFFLIYTLAFALVSSVYI